MTVAVAVAVAVSVSLSVTTSVIVCNNVCVCTKSRRSSLRSTGRTECKTYVVDNLGADIDASVSNRLDDGGNFRQGDRVRQSCGIRLGRSVSLSGCLSVDLE